MKKFVKSLLKSTLVLTLTFGITTGSTSAYFSSVVTAPDNEITTGTLLMAIDSTQNHGAYLGTGYLESPADPTLWDGYNLAVQNLDGTVANNGEFEAWSGVAPGDSTSVWAAVTSRGTIPFNFRSAATGEWTAGPRFGGDIAGPDGLSGTADDITCPATPADGDASLVSVTNVHLYRATNAGGGCESDAECINLRDSLLAEGYTAHQAGVTAGDSGPVTGYYYGTEDGADGTSGGSRLLLAEDEFVIYRIDLELDGPATNDCYQGATYNYDLTGEAKQEADPAW